MNQAVAGQSKREQLKTVLSGAGRLSSRAGTATSHQDPTKRSFLFITCRGGCGMKIEFDPYAPYYVCSICATYYGEPDSSLQRLALGCQPRRHTGSSRR